MYKTTTTPFRKSYTNSLISHIVDFVQLAIVHLFQPIDPHTHLNVQLNQFSTASLLLFSSSIEFFQFSEFKDTTKIIGF